MPLLHSARFTLAALLLVGVGLVQAAEEITPSPAFTEEQLTAYPENGWITNGGNVSNQRFSPLTQINKDNVKDLKAVFRGDLADSALELRHNNQAQPLVYEGVMYVSTGQDDVFAISLDTGETLWSYFSGLKESDAFVCCGWVSRGVGMGDPGPDIVRDDVDAGRAAEPGRRQETVQVAGGGVEVVAALRLVAVAKAARLEHVDLASCLDEQRDDLAPSDPTHLGPAGDQDDRLARTCGHIVEAQPVHPDHVVGDIAERGLCRLRPGRARGAEGGQENERSEWAHRLLSSR